MLPDLRGDHCVLGVEHGGCSAADGSHRLLVTTISNSLNFTPFLSYQAGKGGTSLTAVDINPNPRHCRLGKTVSVLETEENLILVA